MKSGNDNMSEKIDIILPNRIGDLILSLPALLCLKQLTERYRAGRTRFRLVTHIPINEVLSAIDLYEVIPFNYKTKIISWLNPAKKAFFLATTSKNFGYHGKMMYGVKLSNKKLLRYSFDLKYLTDDPKTCFPEEMFSFLKDSLQLPVYAIRHFGLCLELGYTFDQILETFQFDPDHLSVNNEFFKEKPLEESNYLVFCMEAAYGRKKHNSDRRWNVEHFFDLAERAYNQHNVKSVFIGISELPELPDRSYFIDFRRKLVFEIVQLLLFRGYVETIPDRYTWRISEAINRYVFPGGSVSRIIRFSPNTTKYFSSPKALKKFSSL
jgi:ADP-heptose:LPS heptosyltransferase